MEIVNFLAQLWGFSLVIISLAFLINPQYFKEVHQTTRSQGHVVLLGMISLLVGIILILTYNTWVWDWRVLITILGWAILIKGIIRLFFPGFVINVWNTLESKKNWHSLYFLVAILVGCFLLYNGFTS